MVGAAGRRDARARPRGRPHHDRRPGRRAAGRGRRPRSRPGGARHAGRRARERADRPRAGRRGCPGDPPLRHGRAARGPRGVHGPRRRDARRRRARRARRRRRLAGLGARRRADPGRGPGARGGRAAAAARRAPAGLPRGQGERARLRGARGRVHPDHRRRGTPVLGLPRLPRPQARQGRRARPGPAGHPDPDGHGVPDRGAALEVLRRRHGPAVPDRAGHGRPPRLLRAGLHGALLRGSRLPGPRQLHRQLQPRDERLRRGAEEGLGRAQLLLQHVVRPGPRAAGRRALVTAGRLRPDARDVRPRLRIVGLPRRHRSRQRVGDHRRPRPRLLPGEPLPDGHRAPRHPGGRARHDQGDRIPRALVGADPQRHRVPRLLAAHVLHQRGRRRRVLGVPREGRDHGPLPPAQVGDPGAGRGRARAVRGHARHHPAQRRAGRLHGDVQRDGRDDRRRDGLPARRRQLPLRRRRPVRRRPPQAARRAARARAGLDQADDRRAAQRRRPGPGEPRHPQGDRLVGGPPAAARRAQVVPLPRRADRRLRRHPDRRVAHGLQRRARLRGLLPSRRRARGVGRDHARGGAARPQAARARRARHGAHRGGPDLRGLRVRRPGGPVRGGDRLHGRTRRRRRLPRQGRPDLAQGASAAHARRPRARGQRGRPAMATACTSAAPRWA